MARTGQKTSPVSLFFFPKRFIIAVCYWSLVVMMLFWFLSGRDVGQPGVQLHQRRVGGSPLGHRSRQHRALPELQDQGRLHDSRLRQRSPVCSRTTRAGLFKEQLGCSSLTLLYCRLGLEPQPTEFISQSAQGKGRIIELPIFFPLLST